MMKKVLKYKIWIRILTGAFTSSSSLSFSSLPLPFILPFRSLSRYSELWLSLSRTFTFLCYLLSPGSLPLGVRVGRGAAWCRSGHSLTHTNLPQTGAYVSTYIVYTSYPLTYPPTSNRCFWYSEYSHTCSRLLNLFFQILNPLLLLYVEFWYT